VEASVVDEVTEDAPTTGDNEKAENAFEGWAADQERDIDETTFAFHFQKDEAEFYYEAGDKASVWATFGVNDPLPGENVNTAEFEFVGAASLTAATGVIVAALLF